MKTSIALSGAAILLGSFVSLAEAQAPIIVAQPTNEVVLAGSTASFSVAVSGTGPFTYQWQFNGTNLRYGVIHTVAGNGAWGYSGNGGPATSAELNYPRGVAADASGDLFIADGDNNVIREVGTNGIIATVAGNGRRGYSGYGGAATSAELSGPNGVAVDAFGNLFIADEDNNAIRKVVFPPMLVVPCIPRFEIDARFHSAVYCCRAGVPVPASSWAPAEAGKCGWSRRPDGLAVVGNAQSVLTWSTEAGGQYQLQCNSELSSTNWANLGSAVTAAGSTLKPPLEAWAPTTTGASKTSNQIIISALDVMVRDLISSCSGLYESEQQRISRSGDSPVIEAVEFVDLRVGVAGFLHHPPHIRVLLVAPEQLQFTIPGDQQQCRSVLAHVVERGHVVHHRLLGADAALIADREMGNGLAAEWNDAGEAAGVEAVSRQPAFVQPDHAREIAARRMAADEDAVRRAPILPDVAKGPGDRGGGVLDVRRGLGARAETVARRHHRNPLFFQAVRNKSLTIRESPAVEPDDCGEAAGARRIVNVQAATFPHVIRQLAFGSIEDVGLGGVVVSFRSSLLGIYQRRERANEHCEWQREA